VQQYCKIPISRKAHIPVQYAVLNLHNDIFVWHYVTVFFFGNVTPCNLPGTDYLLEGIFPSSSGFIYIKYYNPPVGSLGP